VTVEAGARVLEAIAILDRYGADTGPATGPGAIGGGQRTEAHGAQTANETCIDVDSQ
jgi:hypothetical protein